MSMLWISIGVLVVLAAIVLVGVLWKSRRRGMSVSSRVKVEKALSQAMNQQDPVRRVWSMDTALDLALGELGFAGSLGEKLKNAGPRIPNIQAVWDAHKLRNRLAHEHDAAVSQAEIDRAVRILEHAIRFLAQ